MQRLKFVMWIAVILVAFVFIWMVKDTVLSHFITSRTGIDLSMDGVMIYPSHIHISHLRIKNPRGSVAHSAFTTKDVRIDSSISEWREDPSYIEQIEFHDSHLLVECKSLDCKNNNWSQMALEKRGGVKKGFVIDRAIFRDVTVELIRNGKHEKVKHLPLIELTNLSSEEGFPMQSLIKGVMKEANMEEFGGAIPGPGRRVERRMSRREALLQQNS